MSFSRKYSKAELSIRQVGDYSIGVNQARILYPWSSPNRLDNPSNLPAGAGKDAAFSPNKEFLAVAHTTTPYVTIYDVAKLDSPVFTKLSNPGSLPAGNATGVAWSPDGEFLVVAHATTPYITIYQRDGNTFTKLSNPGSLPAGDATGVAWSMNGKLLAVSHATSPYVTIYRRSGTTFTKLSDPSSLPGGDATGVAFSPNWAFLAVSHVGDPYVTIYSISHETFTKLTSPLDVALSLGTTGQANGVAWSSDSNYLSVSYDSSPFLSVYRRGQSSFYGLPLENANGTVGDTMGIAAGMSWLSSSHLCVGHADYPYLAIYQVEKTGLVERDSPGVLPTGDAEGVRFSLDGEFLVVAHATSPYVTIYQTGSSLPDNATVMVKGDPRIGL